MGLINSFEGLVAMRVLLGLFEAGLFPGTPIHDKVLHLLKCSPYSGCVYLISMYYKRHELQWRFTLFFSMSIMAGAFGGVSHASVQFNYILD
jgi:MFS family permease